VLDLAGSLLLPGLINAHDHLELNNFPRLKWRERYANAREWIADFQPRFAADPALAEPRAVPLADRLHLGGLKNLLAGATTVCHHNPLHPPLRRRFPVRVVQRYRFSHSLLIDGDAVAGEYRRAPANWPWIIHLAEGTDAEAAGELERLAQLGCLGPNTVVVHGVGLRPADRARLLAAGGGLIWCPASNLFTLGATAQVAELARADRVALGSDSRLSGSRDLLDEMRVALETGQVDEAALLAMVTAHAAALLRLPQAGRLAPGLPADALVLAAPAGTLAGALAAGRAAVGLVLVGGRALYGAPEFAPAFAATGVQASPVCVDGRDMLLARWIVERTRRAAVREPGLELAPA